MKLSRLPPDIAGGRHAVAARRLLTLKFADQILVLYASHIVERGTYAELVAAGGLYTRIYDLQLKDQETAAEGVGG